MGVYLGVLIIGSNILFTGRWFYNRLGGSPGEVL